MGELHIGFIGGGNITHTHARAAQSIPGLKIAAFFGLHSEKVQKLSEEFGGNAYSDFSSFLKHRPMDLVAIGSPSGLHAQHGIACVKNGLHVLVEKPIDISLAQADALITESEAAGVCLGVFFQDRFKPDVRRLKQLVAEGSLGRMILADGRVKWYRPPEYYSGSRWRGTLTLDGGGALINQAVHTVDLLVWLAGDVRRVQARMGTLLHRIEGEDTLIALLEFGNGAMGTFEATTSVFPGYPRRIELSGEQGTAVLEHDSIASIRLKSGQVEVEDRPVVLSESQSSPVVSDISAHRAVLEDFVRAIQTNGRPACDGHEARRSLEVVEAIYQAARTGKAVEITSR